MNQATSSINLLIFCITLFLSNYCYTENITSKIAIVAPFTGIYSIYGKQLLIGANKAICDNPNALIELIPFDDQCNQDLAKSVANKIILDHQIKAVIGHTCSSATVAASQIYAKHGILHLVPITTSYKVTEQNITTLFRISGSDDTQAQSISNFVLKNFNHKKIAILHTSDLYGQSLITRLQEQLAMLNIFPALYQKINIEYFNNFIKTKHIIKKLKKLNIDLIIFSGLYKETASLIKTMNYCKIKIPIIVSSSMATKKFINAAGSPTTVAGVIMSFPKLPINLLSKKDLPDFSLFSYAAIQIINTALQNNTSTNGRILAHWLHQNTVSTILGDKSWDTNGNIIDDEFVMYVWNNKGNYSLIINQ